MLYDIQVLMCDRSVMWVQTDFVIIVEFVVVFDIVNKIIDYT